MLLRNFLALILASLIPGCQMLRALQPQGPPTPSAVAHALNSTVILVAATENKVVCAGEFVTPSIVATAYHCLDSLSGCDDGDEQCYTNRPVGFYTYSNFNKGETDTPNVGFILNFKKAYDLALIKTDMKHEFVVLNPLLPVPGQDVFAIGHPRGNPFVVSTGFVRQSIILNPEPDTEVSIEIHGGSSGGGLYDANGHLLGICQAGTLDGKVGLFGLSYTVAELLLRSAS